MKHRLINPEPKILMKALTEIPFTLDSDQIMIQAHVEAGSAYAADLVSLIESAQAIGHPKAAYTQCYVTARDGDEVRLDGVWFRSQTLAHNLTIYVCTLLHQV